ncbi:hypothetical protein TGAM01_v201698 [Trichoderma gamsii]|uniref:Uncharacterized protein n=1 Tax=Trichoderma gamsii TaxID=398673 RepID=A0A2P4ZYS3_9HYPO|nr:hypothetical protein TGAM01_v201698 [Trichoderma gamsii]PON29449.1 hypothetical protein TGAM01_v201698 [Trichoderma gamsii]
MAPWPDKSRSSLWGPDVYLRDAHTQASGCSHVPQPRKSEARSSSDSAKRTQLNDSSSKRINLKQAPASLPRRANTAQLPVPASAPMLVSATWSRAWTDSAAADKALFNAMPCHARHAPLPPTFASEWGPAKRHRNLYCIAI